MMAVCAAAMAQTGTLSSQTLFLKARADHARLNSLCLWCSHGTKRDPEGKDKVPEGKDAVIEGESRALQGEALSQHAEGHQAAQHPEHPNGHVVRTICSGSLAIQHVGLAGEPCITRPCPASGRPSAYSMSIQSLH